MKVVDQIKCLTSKAALKVKKNSPEILMAVGAVSFVGCVVVACKETLGCEEILDWHREKADQIKEALEVEPEAYTKEDADRDRFILFVKTGAKFAKLYAPAVGLGVLSLVCFGSAHGIMKKRNVALTAAYTVLDKTFNEYRQKVIETRGEDEDRYFRYGLKREKNGKVLEKDENGEEKVIKKDIDTVPWMEEPASDDPYTSKFVFSPQTSKAWTNDEMYNDTFLSCQLRYMNNLYSTRGYLFLNEVLDALGMKQVSYGQLVGWYKGCGDDYVNFRSSKTYIRGSEEYKSATGAEWIAVYTLDFNTCGLIWDKI